MKGAGDFGFALLAGAAGHAAGQGHLLFMRAEVLGGIPLVPAGEMEDGDLVVSMADAGASVRRNIFHPAGQEPFHIAGGGKTRGGVGGSGRRTGYYFC